MWGRKWEAAAPLPWTDAGADVLQAHIYIQTRHRKSEHVLYLCGGPRAWWSQPCKIACPVFLNVIFNEKRNFLGEFEPGLPQRLFRYPKNDEKRQNPDARHLTYGRPPSTLRGVMNTGTISTYPLLLQRDTRCTAFNPWTIWCLNSAKCSSFESNV